MIQKTLHGTYIFITCFLWASVPAISQVGSGGVVASSSAVFDFTNAGQTIPTRKLVSEPATCTPGEQYFNTTSNVLKVCNTANSWVITTPSGTSGGIPYFSSASVISSSASLNANSVVVGGGTGAAPVATGVTIDASNNVTAPGAVTTGSGGSAHGKLTLGELPSNGATAVGWEAPDLVGSSLSLVFPNANPAANSLMVFPAPTSGQAQWTWSPIPGCLDTSGNHLNFNSGTGAITCGTSSSGATPNMTVANAGTTGTTVNTLTKLTGTPATAVISAAGDTGGVIGITTGGAGTSGSATIAYAGIASCVFDGLTTAGDYVQISSITAGNCHDTGTANYPNSGQVIGRVLSTNGAGGIFSVALFPAEQRGTASTFGTGLTLAGGIVSPDTAILLSRATDQAFTDKVLNPASTSGTTYTANLTPALTVYTPGQEFMFVPDVNCGAAPSININSLGPIALQKLNGNSLVALTANDCIAKVPYLLRAHSTTPPNVDSFVMGPDTAGRPTVFQVGSNIVSAATIAPTAGITHITGTATVSTITPPAGFAQTGMGGCLVLIPDGLWSTNTSGNIALASAAVVSKALTMCYDNGNSQWYPSY